VHRRLYVHVTLSLFTGAGARLLLEGSLGGGHDGDESPAPGFA
jgi:hypothetical protein